MKIRAAVSPLVNKLKTRVVYFAVAIALMLGLANARIASAQNASQAVIPFAFSANHQAFPAGHYRVFRESESYLRVVSTETGISTGLMVRTTRNFEVKPKNSLVFLRDGRGYQLLTVQFAQGSVGVQSELAVQPKSEREIAKATTGATMVIGMN